MRKILSCIRRAVDDYQMIQEGDRIAVGVSGGKDSLTVLCALKSLQRFYPKKFDLEAITLDMGVEGMDFSQVSKLCEELDVPYTIIKTNIKEIVFDIRHEKNPCALCAKMRRGALNEAAKERGINKIALGHHYDDVLETFYLSLFYEGRVHCFTPVTYLDRTELFTIRLMIYTTEQEIKSYAKRAQLPIVHNPCPANGNTKRQYIKDLLARLDYENRGMKERSFTALIHSGLEGWNPVKNGKAEEQ